MFFSSKTIEIYQMKMDFKENLVSINKGEIFNLIYNIVFFS